MKPRHSVILANWLKPTQWRGFSLIELLVVLSIISILAALIYPSYSSYINQARRTDGQSALMDLACRMEQYYSKYNTYKNATINTGKKTDVLNSNLSPEHWYILSITQASDSTYSLQARNTQNASDKSCALLTLNSAGAKGGSSSSESSTHASCW